MLKPHRVGVPFTERARWLLLLAPTSSSSRNPSPKTHTQSATQHIFPHQPSGEFGSSSLP
jgi:hypothetical protein